MKEQTLIMIKPDGVQKQLTNEILRRFKDNGLVPVDLEMKKLEKSFVCNFYSHLQHKLSEKLFNATMDFMTSDFVVLALIEGEDAIKRTRALCGPTNPAEAPKGTIRGDFSEDDMDENTRKEEATKNVIHSSANQKELEIEVGLIREAMKIFQK